MKRIDAIENRAAGQQWDIDYSQRRVLELETLTTKLLRALEWHVGAPLDLILTERKLTKLKFAHDKEIREEIGIGGGEDGKGSGSSEKV